MMDDPVLNNIRIALIVGFVTVLISLFVLLLARLRDLLPPRHAIIADKVYLIVLRREDLAGDILKVIASLCLLVVLAMLCMSCFGAFMALLAGAGILEVFRSLLFP